MYFSTALPTMIAVSIFHDYSCAIEDFIQAMLFKASD
jgi:hypothetical protein